MSLAAAISGSYAGDLSSLSLPHCDWRPSEQQPPPTPAVRTLCVFGERHSGINLVHALLELNFAVDRHPSLVDARGKAQARPSTVGTGCTAAKHSLQPETPIAAWMAHPTSALPAMDSALAFLLTRNAFDWAAAFSRAPWETSLQHDTPVRAFVERPWSGRGAAVERPWSRDWTAPPGVHFTGGALEMRAAKHRQWLTLKWPMMEQVQF